MKPQLLVERYFKLSFETNELFARYASTVNPEFGNGRVDCKNWTGIKPTQF